MSGCCMSDNYKDLARSMIKQHEGLRLSPYRCTADKLTIGYGRNLESNGISAATANQMLDEDLERQKLTLADLLAITYLQRYHTLDAQY
jgi:GH24 family phage-related lysozyme (muramidase)